MGHLVELAEPHDYEQGLKEWSFTKLPIIPASFKMKPVPGTQARQLAVLEKLMNTGEVNLVINACDAGREGELIFRRIFTWCGCRKPVKRLWLSEATATAVKKAFSSLRNGRELDNLAVAAEARAKADWLVGINATRAFSVRHSAVLSVGRVQTPTLALIVNREREINNFRPETYWEVWATFQRIDGGIYRGKWFTEKNDRLHSKIKAETIANKPTVSGKVTRVEQKEKREQPPQLFNLNELQKEANKRYGLTAQETLEAAQEIGRAHV
jgi:DNA topoisomerase-3